MTEQISYKVEKGFALWFTGLPGAGKSTVSAALKTYLEDLDVPVVLFDGDVARRIVAEGVGRSAADRVLLTERYARLTSLVVESRVIVILAAINHSEPQRAAARAAHPPGQFGLVWINTSLETCQARDPKGLYARAEQKAAKGEAPQVVGMDIRFEDPAGADIEIATEGETLADSCVKFREFLLRAGAITARGPNGR